MGFSEIDLYLICTKKGDGEILDSQISPFTWAFMASPAGFEPPERPENAPVAHFQREWAVACNRPRAEQRSVARTPHPGRPPPGRQPIYSPSFSA